MIKWFSGSGSYSFTF